MSAVSIVLPSTDPKKLQCPLAQRLYNDLKTALEAVGSTPAESRIVIVVPSIQTVANLECATLLQALDDVRHECPDAHVLVWMGSIRDQFSPEGLRDLATCRDASVQAGGGMQLMETQAPLYGFMVDHGFRIIKGVSDALTLLPDAAKGIMQTS